MKIYVWKKLVQVSTVVVVSYNMSYRLMSFFTETNKLRLGGIAKNKKKALSFMQVWTDNFFDFFPSLMMGAGYNWDAGEIS